MQHPQGGRATPGFSQRMVGAVRRQRKTKVSLLQLPHNLVIARRVPKTSKATPSYPGLFDDHDMLSKVTVSKAAVRVYRLL